MPSAHLYALIMAGGSGTRLWPKSRGGRPKQFLDLLGPRTMLQEAFDRLVPLIPPERILVGTGREYVATVIEQLPNVPVDNVLGEPSGRGTAAAIALAAIHARTRDPGAILAVVTADHLIGQVDAFRSVLGAAAELAVQGWLVTLGIQPTYPETGYGYVERGERLATLGGFDAYQVARFVEKPARDVAEQYVRSGRYSWNSGMFVWTVDRVVAEMARQMPTLHAGLIEIERALGSPSADETLGRIWPGLPNQTIDYGIMERAERVAVFPVDLGWSDVGSWAAVYDALPRDDRGNAVVGEHLSPDTTGSLIYAPNRLVATVGLEDLIVVDAGHVLLICPRARAQDVRTLVAMLQQQGHMADL